MKIDYYLSMNCTAEEALRENIKKAFEFEAV